MTEKKTKLACSLSYVDASLWCKCVHMYTSTYLSHLAMKEEENLEDYKREPTVRGMREKENTKQPCLNGIVIASTLYNN